ncbi:MAG: preprotein translocase subunit YajC [Spirochaetaceae bacterium]|jgi:preprotein translocase subunit YajC|nr:preprotein translocase subunit YajC [Spirochaetaceae bacterium]
MHSFDLPLLLGQAQAQGGEQGALGGIMTFIPFILIIGVFYFLIIRPQNKKQKDTQKMLSALKKGDKAITIGGIHGTICAVRESSVVLKVDDNTKIEFSRSAIASITAVAKEDDSSEEKTTEEKSEK